MIFLILTSSRMFLFEADRDQDRNPQLAQTQRTTDCRVPCLADLSSTQLIHPGLREHCGRRGKRIVRAEDQEVRFGNVSCISNQEGVPMRSQHGSLNKT